MHASQLVVVGSGLLALAVSVILWPVVGYAITLAHEGGHALAASMMGGTVDYLNMDRGRGGETKASGLGPVGGFLMGIAGYTGPSGFGVGGALLLAHDQVRLVLWLSVLFLLAALFASGTYVARFTVVVVGALAVLLIRKGSAGQQVFFTYTWIWFLLLGGFGHVLVLQRIRAEGDPGSDALLLRRMTFLPASLFSGFFWLVSVCALLFGGAVLLRLYHAGP
ncbi:M50 family metallopeptidase [Dactylosporangium sp. NPDC049140]|uniref:M50 family metallopeptidase n=1 Tax=Dactylosporangium sp. NPDC049140 TaxID=3155647 RepID=UPI0033C2AB78